MDEYSLHLIACLCKYSQFLPYLAFVFIDMSVLWLLSNGLYCAAVSDLQEEIICNNFSY